MSENDIQLKELFDSVEADNSAERAYLKGCEKELEQINAYLDTKDIPRMHGLIMLTAAERVALLAGDYA